MRSGSRSSCFLRKSIPPAYLITNDTAQVFVACIQFPPFNFERAIFLMLRKYSLLILSFIWSRSMSPASSTPSYLHPSLSSIALIVVSSGSVMPYYYYYYYYFLFCVAYTKCVATWHDRVYLFVHESRAPVTW